jgi:hypothetical protein
MITHFPGLLRTLPLDVGLLIDNAENEHMVV